MVKYSSQLPSLKLTYPLKIDPWKRRFLLETIIFRGYVSFRQPMWSLIPRRVTKVPADVKRSAQLRLSGSSWLRNFGSGTMADAPWCLLGFWWFQRFFIYTPEPWGNDPIWRAYFSDGLVQPPTSWCLLVFVLVAGDVFLCPRNWTHEWPTFSNRTPKKPEYLACSVSQTYWTTGGRWDSVPFNCWWKQWHLDQMCQGLNSHYFHIIGDKLINPIVGVKIYPL